ncbi:ligand-dependent corepressor isoform X2 [Boleophthalmus pectinirostris]|uniref:ligand-dependent corepressor isoform X2 n=1 Tax=Boleophthalmus pectinirostris TaxID=150288 RepID=UPI00242BE10F|nr:ligand-dependent corepressor isoform X2 [Boleophthalmus pectinirostris]
MASLCKRQQCTIDRRGFRQELDSWRHKLIHCVGFESILEGLFGPELVQDLQLFKDREPLAVSDWSFDENCIFCCLRRNKVKEQLSSLNSDGLEDPPKPLLAKDQTLLIKLERQAEEFLSAVLRRKDVPNFSDPHVPVVAREILQGMIRQFAAEYTSKSSPQEPSASQPHCDQSLPCAQPLSPPLSSAHNLNPVLSKLLMIDQDAPLDLTIKKPPVESTEQDGVLDLSIKKNRNSSCLSPVTSTPKGRSLRADELLMRSRQDGRRENIGHSARSKSSPSISYSLHIKEEVASESDADHSRPNGSPPWKLKTNGTHFRLKNNDMNEHLKDIPKLLELAGLISKSLVEKPHENGRDQLSLGNSAFDLKIPQVRTSAGASDQSWDSLSPEYSGLRYEKKLHSILPHKRHINGLNGSTVEKEHWPFNGERGNNILDADADMGMKQPRKKRGRYRQYNTELLEEAIVVVMSGKMSVSKAQSIYGIPHSTLEYKVKERLGTLKNPPKKKLRLMSQAEEQEEPWLCKGKESPDSPDRESANLSLQE